MDLPISKITLGKHPQGGKCVYVMLELPDGIEWLSQGVTVMARPGEWQKIFRIYDRESRDEKS